MAAVVLIVTLFLTPFLAPMPKAVLGGIVFLIGYGLIDVKGLKHVKKLAPTEFWIALITAVVVCCVGVEQGIILALVVLILLIIERSYRAHRFVVAIDSQGDPSDLAADPGAQSQPGLIIFRYDAPLFYANANRFADDVEVLRPGGARPRHVGRARLRHPLGRRLLGRARPEQPRQLRPRAGRPPGARPTRQPRCSRRSRRSRCCPASGASTSSTASTTRWPPSAPTRPGGP